MKQGAIVLALGVVALSPAVSMPAAPLNPIVATKIADATVAAWTSMSAARIKALYAPSVIGFDYAVAPLTTDRAIWDRQQDAYAAAKIDKATQLDRKLQILGADTFVMSGRWNLASSAIPANDGAIRCTDVFQRQATGKWLIVNEHCSLAPKG